MAFSKQGRRNKIKKRIRKKVFGTQQMPRMTVYRSNNQIYVQLVNDEDGKTLVSASSLNKDIVSKEGITKREQAKLVGQLAAEKSKAAGIEQVVFDRNGYLYHGRVKELADAAREGGLKF
jgi:large subunit ribosomal protein L18